MQCSLVTWETETHTGESENELPLCRAGSSHLTKLQSTDGQGLDCESLDQHEAPWLCSQNGKESGQEV